MEEIYERRSIRPATNIIGAAKLVPFGLSTYTDIANPAADLSGSADLVASCDVNSIAQQYIYLFLDTPTLMPISIYTPIITKNVHNLYAVLSNQSFNLYGSWAVKAVTDLAGLTPQTLNWNNQGTLVLDADETTDIYEYYPSNAAPAVPGAAGFVGENPQRNLIMTWMNTGAEVLVYAFRIAIKDIFESGGVPPTTLTSAYIKTRLSSAHDGSVVRGWMLSPDLDLT